MLDFRSAEAASGAEAVKVALSLESGCWSTANLARIFHHVSGCVVTMCTGEPSCLGQVVTRVLQSSHLILAAADVILVEYLRVYENRCNVFA